jgi:hypothetical protein
MSTEPEHLYGPGHQTAQLTADLGPASRDGAGRQVTGKKGGLLGRGWRKMTWVLIGWSTLIVVGSLMASGHTVDRTTAECQSTLGAGGMCQEAASATGAAQFEHLMKIGVVGFVVLSLVWFMTRQKN